ncbi:hypothetical protein IF690_03955 [Pseudomonas sp. SK3(2021)]|uniref:hypothetical protein n=1 Tax=Pseudomonas sp. SK3(2021) TaxID=2841064 RepID=UPI00192A7A4A|nr:hypothetical protein [Pseudomonas sp. SK3(2021)]QQZ42708.1 hypothetical protein IF690_03955 [Pseudomonas sp. SK3(2021)]
MDETCPAGPCRRGIFVPLILQERPVDARLLAMLVNDDAGCLDVRVVLGFFAGKLATEGRWACPQPKPKIVENILRKLAKRGIKTLQIVVLPRF